MSKPVSLAWRDRPFDGAFHHRTISPGGDGRMPRIAEIVEDAADLPRGFQEIGEVRINGEVVPRDAWRAVRPRAVRDVCITLHMPLRDSGSGRSGGKNTAALVATIAVRAG